MSPARLPFWLTVTVILIAAFLGMGLWYYYQLSNRIVWSMVHVSDDETSADAHLLEFPDGHTVLIDAGFDESARRVLIPYLDERGVERIDQLIVSHAHRNHYGGIESLLQRPGYVSRVYFNLPPESRCRRGAGGCDYATIAGTRDRIERSGTSLRTLSTDELLYHSDEHDIILEVVYALAGEAAGAGPSTPGGAGAVLRLIYGNTTVLFAGDVDEWTGDLLIDEHFFLESTLLTIPLHGGDGASDRFLRRVDPEAILVSNGARQWHGRRGDRVRRYALDRNVDTYVNGLHGNVVVALTRDGFSVDTQRTPADR